MYSDASAGGSAANAACNACTSNASKACCMVCGKDCKTTSGSNEAGGKLISGMVSAGSFSASKGAASALDDDDDALAPPPSALLSPFLVFAAVLPFSASQSPPRSYRPPQAA